MAGIPLTVHSPRYILCGLGQAWYSTSSSSSSSGMVSPPPPPTHTHTLARAQDMHTHIPAQGRGGGQSNHPFSGTFGSAVFSGPQAVLNGSETSYRYCKHERRRILTHRQLLHCKKSVLKIQEIFMKARTTSSIFLHFSILSYWSLNKWIYPYIQVLVPNCRILFFYSVYSKVCNIENMFMLRSRRCGSSYDDSWLRKRWKAKIMQIINEFTRNLGLTFGLWKFSFSRNKFRHLRIYFRKFFYSEKRQQFPRNFEKIIKEIFVSTQLRNTRQIFFFRT
jgi:hypothetical protein